MIAWIPQKTNPCSAGKNGCKKNKKIHAHQWLPDYLIQPRPGERPGVLPLFLGGSLCAWQLPLAFFLFVTASHVWRKFKHLLRPVNRHLYNFTLPLSFLRTVIHHFLRVDILRTVIGNSANGVFCTFLKGIPHAQTTSTLIYPLITYKIDMMSFSDL